jgi:hypothetical protein
VSADPITVDELPACLAELRQRMSAVEADQRFMWNLFVLSPYGVLLSQDAPRDPRVLRRPRFPRPKARGHL